MRGGEPWEFSSTYLWCRVYNTQYLNGCLDNIKFEVEVVTQSLSTFSSTCQ